MKVHGSEGIVVVYQKHHDFPGAVDMSSVAVFVGLDYHQAFVQVCVVDAAGKVLGNRRCDNSAAAIMKYVALHGGTVAAAIESCCGAAALADELIAGGWQVSLAHAGYVNKAKQSPDKTDWSDARLLADLLRISYLPRVWLPPANVRQLRHVVRYRHQLARSKRNAKLRTTAILRTHRVELAVKRWTKLWGPAVRECEALGVEGRWVVGQLLDEIEHLQRQLSRVEERLAQLTRDDALVQKLLEYPGIGLVTAVTLRAEWGDIRRFRSGKQLSRFCCVTPRNVSSGLRQAEGGLIKAGNPQLRTVIIEAAHRLQRHDLRWAQFGCRLREQGKPGSVIAAAVANRWIRWLYHQLLAI
jgi:transposase